MSQPSNADLQLQEIEAITAIYGDLWRHDGNKTLTFDANIDGDRRIVLTVHLGDDYPLAEPPCFEISCPYLGKAQKDEISQRLQDEYLNNVGAPVLYQWSEILRHYAQNLKKEQKIADQSREGRAKPADVIRESAAAVAVEDSDNPPPVIFTGEPLTDRKSTFQASVCPVISRQEVNKALQALKANPKVARATHNMFAYRITADGKRFIQDCDDDGEHHAGSRLLHLLEVADARNVLVVVSRWYGGIQLGPDRFKHINNVARALLEREGFIVHKNK